MKNTFKGFINYGAIQAEKRQIWTSAAPHAYATAYDEVEITIPDGWTADENAFGDMIITAPWGWDYKPDELLQGNENPYFAGFDQNGNGFRIKLDWHMI